MQGVSDALALPSWWQTVNTIVLWSRFISIKDGAEETSVSIRDLLALVQSGQWRVTRRDNWVYDARVIAALHTLDARPDVELIDPTGLLGRSRYGDGRNLYEDHRMPVLVVARTGAAGRRAAQKSQKRSGKEFTT